MKKILLSLLVPLTLFAFESQKEAKKAMFSDLEVYRSTLQAQYAPIEWKGIYADWSLTKEVDKAKKLISSLSPIRTKDYQRIVKQFFNGLGDYHVQVSFYSTEEAFLPISFKSADERFFITSVMYNLLPGPGYKAIKPGDELLSINGKSTENALKEYLEGDNLNPLSITDRSLGELHFSHRLGASGDFVPRGSCNMEILHKGESKSVTYSIPWLYFPELINDIIPSNAKMLMKPQARTMAAEVTPSLFSKPMVAPFFTRYDRAKYKMDQGIGSRTSFVPKLGIPLWVSDPDLCHYDAYTFTSPLGYTIGYIRIPHYNASKRQVEQFRELIRKMQSTTDALVLDQVNNPGGNLFYMYALAATLANKPLEVPLQRIALTQKEIIEAHETCLILNQISSDEEAQKCLGYDLDGYPVTLKLAQNCAAFMQDEIECWNRGERFTQPLAVFGIDTIYPDTTIHYTKPILMLINELDFSCGDFLPAILQDNRRAKLFGMRTAGAGGYVLSTSHTNLFGVEFFTYTGSLAFRVDQNPIENLGVHPDIVHEIHQEDLQSNFKTYAEHVVAEVEALLR